jgi:hypothetical protein
LYHAFFRGAGHARSLAIDLARFRVEKLYRDMIKRCGSRAGSVTTRRAPRNARLRLDNTMHEVEPVRSPTRKLEQRKDDE